VAVSGDGFDESEVHRVDLDQDDDEPTPVSERGFMRCLPCLGTGRLRLLGAELYELYETRRPCPYCKGAGTRLVALRRLGEHLMADDMKFADLGRCKGSFKLGRKAAFGRVACSVCGGRYKPVQGLRVPQHVAPKPAKTPLKGDPPR